MSIPFARTLLVALALAGGLSACTETPTDYNNLPRGAFGGVNTGLLSTLITNTTLIAGDTATGVLVAAEIGGAHLSGDPVPRRYFRGLGLFSIGGMAGEVGGVSANGVPLRWVPDVPPAHYELDTSSSAVLALEKNVTWRAGWTTGETIEAGITLPPGFGNVTLSHGREVSVDALHNGDTLGIAWTGVVPNQRVFIYASWQPAVAAPTLVVPPRAILVVSDEGGVPIPGGHLSQMIREPNGHLTFVLYRGEYRVPTTFDNATKSLGTFAYVSDSVRIAVNP